MQQFRPLPKFDTIGEAVSVEKPLTPTTDPLPDLQETDPITVARSPRTAKMPIVLVAGPDTGELAELIRKPSITKPLSLTSALQAALGAPTGSTSARLVVIPAGRKRTKTAPLASPKRLSPRVRRFVLLVVILAVVLGVLTTLVPLADVQNGTLFSDLGSLLRSAQIGWQIQAHQDQASQSTGPASLNGPGLPYMHIADSPYVAVAERDAANAGISPVYFVRQIQQESGFNPNAVSVTNAEGIAQFEPGTAAQQGVSNPFEPIQALRGAAHLMASYDHQYGNYAKALGAYNAGVGAVQGAVYSCGANWLSCMPAQTRDYVYRIMGV